MGFKYPKIYSILLFPPKYSFTYFYSFGYVIYKLNFLFVETDAFAVVREFIGFQNVNNMFPSLFVRSNNNNVSSVRPNILY